MSNLGFGVMLGMLSGNEKSAEAMSKAIGKRIASLRLTDEALHIGFTDGYAIRLVDDGQSCCEHRYMHSDDALQAFVDTILVGAEVRQAPDVVEEDSWDVHEVAFLVITTNLGAFTVETHNEHNGYYGGFLVRCFVDHDPDTLAIVND